METLSAGPTLRGLDADQVCRDPIPTTKSLPVLFGNMGQPCAGWMRAIFACMDHASQDDYFTSLSINPNVVAFSRSVRTLALSSP